MNILSDEKAIQYDCLERLRDFESVTAGQEVPLLGRTIDLAYVKKSNVVSVEFKLRDWKKAIEQARDHLLGADYAYVCMPRRNVTTKLRKAIKIAGVGLVFYREDEGWPFEIIIDAPKSKEIWAVARSMLMEYIMNMGNEYDGQNY